MYSPSHPLVCWLPSHHHYLVLTMPHSIPKKREFCFIFLLSITFPSGKGLGALSHSLLQHAPSDSSSSLHLLGGMSFQHDISPKEFERESQNRLPLSLHRQTIPSLTFDPWLTTHVLTRYKWVMLGPCACSIPMLVYGLSAIHAFAIAYGFV